MSAALDPVVKLYVADSVFWIPQSVLLRQFVGGIPTSTSGGSSFLVLHNAVDRASGSSLGYLVLCPLAVFRVVHDFWLSGSTGLFSQLASSAASDRFHLLKEIRGFLERWIFLCPSFRELLTVVSAAAARASLSCSLQIFGFYLFMLPPSKASLGGSASAAATALEDRQPGSAFGLRIVDASPLEDLQPNGVAFRALITEIDNITPLSGGAGPRELVYSIHRRKCMAKDIYRFHMSDVLLFQLSGGTTVFFTLSPDGFSGFAWLRTSRSSTVCSAPSVAAVNAEAEEEMLTVVSERLRIPIEFVPDLTLWPSAAH